MKSSVTQPVELAPALAAVLGADSVHTGDAQLDAYTADTYWPAISAWANGTPLGRPDVVAIPRSEDDVAAAMRVAAARATPWARSSRSSSSAARARSGSSPAQRWRSCRCRPSAASSRCSSRTSTPASRPSGPRSPPVTARPSSACTTRRRPRGPSRRWSARPLQGVCAVVCCEGEAAATALEGSRTVELARGVGARELDPASGQRWWDRRYEFYKPPHHAELPSIWGTIDVVASYTNIIAVHEALKTSVRDRYADRGLQLRMHFSHWYRWGTMIYARFLIPDGGDDALALHDQIWEDGITAVLAAGGVMNDHHGVGLKLAPYMAAQHGPALDALRAIKTSLDPLGIMNPGKLGL